MLQNRVVRLVPDAGLFEDAVQMAFLAKHTLGDCLYLAAAKQFAVPVITTDVAMRDRGARAYKNITFLGGAEKPRGQRGGLAEPCHLISVNCRPLP